MRTRIKAIFAAILALAAVSSCDYPYEEFSLVQELSSEELRQGVSFDFPMDSGYVYNTAVVCRIESGASVKEDVELCFDLISPDFKSYKETLSFPIVSNVRQKAALGDDANVIFKKRGGNLDNQWGWRRNVDCDTLPGRWRVIISVKDDTDLARVKAVGFTYKGLRK